MNKKTSRTINKSTKKQEEETYILTPKGIFVSCLTDVFNIPFDDRRINLAWEIFDLRMRKFGYVQEENTSKSKGVKC